MIEPFELPMFYGRQNLFSSSRIAVQLSRYDRARCKNVLFQELSDQVLGCCLISTPRHQDIHYIALFIDSPPQPKHLANKSPRPFRRDATWFRLPTTAPLVSKALTILAPPLCAWLH